MSKHTPGPWKIDPIRRGDKEIYISQPGYGWERLEATVSRDDCDSDMALANANLIAAAPELLEALKEIEWSDRGFCPQCGGYPQRGHQEKCLVGNAISKAEGRS